MAKYIFTYSFSAWTKRNPAKSVPCGGSFCAEGARKVMKEIRRDGFEISELRIQMHYADKPLDWQNPISERRFSFS